MLKFRIITLSIAIMVIILVAVIRIIMHSGVENSSQMVTRLLTFSMVIIAIMVITELGITELGRRTIKFKRPVRAEAKQALHLVVRHLIEIQILEVQTPLRRQVGNLAIIYMISSGR